MLQFEDDEEQEPSDDEVEETAEERLLQGAVKLLELLRQCGEGIQFFERYSTRSIEVSRN